MEPESRVTDIVGSFEVTCGWAWQASLKWTGAQLQLFRGATSAGDDFSGQPGQTRCLPRHIQFCRYRLERSTEVVPVPVRLEAVVPGVRNSGCRSCRAHRPLGAHHCNRADLCCSSQRNRTLDPQA